MLPSLIGILLRARQGRYLVIADVEKAFLQVSLKREDRDVTRFLWLKDKSKEATQENLVTFRFARVPFGVVSSPFLLAAVIRHLLSEEHSKLSIEIAKNLYVNNIVLTSESESESIRKAKKAKELFKKAKMQLRRFHANHDINMDNEQEMTEKTKIPQEGLQTKRQILQFYAGIYDPLGIMSPIILLWKLLIQDMWKKGMPWDENLEPEEMRRCLELEKAFNQVDVMEISRWTPQEYSEIHVFVDASEKAMGLALYARRSSNTPCKPQLTYEKTRLVPKRENTNQSPLLAVTLGVKALEFIRQEIEVGKTYLWTDSGCVLHWLRKAPVGSRYISNRIDEIRRCKEIEYRHVRSTNNPADQASRGLPPQNLKENLLWWNGPPWLWEPKENWPENKVMEESIISVCMSMGLMEKEEIQS
uniref:Reverse transcriptase domain-containing protein n=1 Tax=Onchocerca volvulus TaxID=6282 RepID=A0A8R1TJK1_ONCVO